MRVAAGKTYGNIDGNLLRIDSVAMTCAVREHGLIDALATNRSPHAR
jgi:hypothetical protein